MRFHIYIYIYIYDGGFLIINSGGPLDTHESAGVVFIVPQNSRYFVKGYREHSNRITSLDLLVRGGKAALISAYAPQGRHPYDDRNDFFLMVSDTYTCLSSHGPKIVIGDLNARVANVYPGEEHVVGPFLF